MLKSQYNNGLQTFSTRKPQFQKPKFTITIIKKLSPSDLQKAKSLDFKIREAIPERFWNGILKPATIIKDF